MEIGSDRVKWVYIYKGHLLLISQAEGNLAGRRDKHSSTANSKGNWISELFKVHWKNNETTYS